ncbi:MAG: hypothetical protein HY791_32395 [Deltaproteobacteria bacterium]|nr:hypothetical protein [Deltaproteobacteria bacterium]
MCEGSFDASLPDSGEGNSDGSTFDASLPDVQSPIDASTFLDAHPTDFGFPDALPTDLGFRDAQPLDSGRDAGFQDPLDGSLGFDARPFGSRCGGCVDNGDCPLGTECLTHPLFGGTMCMESCSATQTCSVPTETCLLIVCSGCLF